MTRADEPSRARRPADRLREINDPILGPLIDALDERSREIAITALLTDVADPLIASILRRFRRMEPTLQVEDVQEIASLIALRLVHKLYATARHEEDAISTLQSYVSTLTYNAWHDFRRRRYPERYRLKRNLRYILTREPLFALWETTESVVVAGLSRWKDRPAETAATAPTRFDATAAMCRKTRPAEALSAIFDRIGHPMTFDQLVDVVAELWNVQDVVIANSDIPADPRRDQHSSLEQQEYLVALWREVRELPENQRAVLLLNLRDSAGSNALTLFLLLNVASISDLAAVAGLTEQALNELWDELPLDDLTIAARLKLTRQQVINLRKSARLRLSRRMAKSK
ncbi:MAG TPA: hypothetical protein VEK79_00325 [Thermoanaerobaculia bacterium]|nr:hypothetical protein [Thermoanaerobaculia bacterium]